MTKRPILPGPCDCFEKQHAVGCRWNQAQITQSQVEQLRLAIDRDGGIAKDSSEYHWLLWAEEQLEYTTVPLTDQEQRDSYYILRAMHDAACPNCGATDHPGSFKTDDGLRCSKCGFMLTWSEVRAIEAVTADVNARRLESFRRARVVFKGRPGAIR